MKLASLGTADASITISAGSVHASVSKRFRDENSFLFLVGFNLLIKYVTDGWMATV